MEDDGGAEKSCVAHNNSRTVSERFYQDHGDSASKYPNVSEHSLDLLNLLNK
jgi:hypothetical protein